MRVIGIKRRYRKIREDDVCYMVKYDGAICLPREWIRKAKMVKDGFYVADKLPDIGSWICTETRDGYLCYMQIEKHWIPWSKKPRTPEEYREYDVAWHVARGYLMVKKL